MPSRLAWPLLLIMAISAPVIGWGVHQGFERANNNIAQWLPEGYPETEAYARFRELFGSDEFALVTWPGCTLDDRRLERLAEAIRASQAKDDSLFERVRTGPELMRALMDEPLELSFEEAARRLEGTLVGPESADSRITGALVTFSERGHANRTAAVERLRELAAKATDLPPEEIRLGGDAVTNAAIDIESERAVRQWIALSWGIALLVAWACLRSVKLVAMVFVTAGYSAAMSSALIYYTGATMNLVLVIVPVLVYVLTLSACVHLSNYYRDAVRAEGVSGAARRALAVGWLPALMSAGTTSLGLISLVVSHLRPVKQFGIFSALGTMVSLGVLLLVMPALLDRWPPRRRKNDDDSRAETKRAGRRVRIIGYWVVRFRWPVLTVGLAVFAVLAVGVGFIETTVAPGRFFDRQSPWVQDAMWIQEHLGPIVPLEVMLEFPRRADEREDEGDKDRDEAENRQGKPSDDDGSPYALSLLGRLELADRVARLIERHDLVGGTLSAATFGPDLDELAGGRVGAGWLERSVTNRQLRRNLRHFERMGFVRRTDDAEFWRVSARVPGFSDVDHDLLLKRIERDVDAYLQRAELTREQVRPTYTGIVPLVFVAQRELLTGLFESFLLAFALIAVVMVILLRSVTAGAVAMLPNVFPAVTVFGVMGWSGMPVDVGAMMTASVALGIAVDDTIHFLFLMRATARTSLEALQYGTTRPTAIGWFRCGRAEDHSRQAAVVGAFERCAPAMTQTTLIAGLGLLVYVQSHFLPIAQFGLLMFILLLAALVGDLLLLPAILATRLGEGFGGRVKSEE